MKLALAAHDSTNVATQSLLYTSGILCATLYEYYLSAMKSVTGTEHHVAGEVLKHNIERKHREGADILCDYGEDSPEYEAFISR